jgi:hypothetical protein
MMMPKAPAYTITPNGLDIYEQITFDEWLDCGQHLWEVRRRIQWCIGDWLEFGERKWGEKYAQAVSVTEYHPQTLKNLAAVSRSFPDKKYRGQYHLSHSHFAAVAAKDIPADKKAEFLQAAVDNGMSREDVRAAVRSWRGEPEEARSWSVSMKVTQREITVVLPPYLVGQTVVLTAKAVNNGE